MLGASGGSGSRRFVAIVGALFALSALCVPRAHAQDDSWGGSVEASTQAIDISEGKSVSYSVRLSEPPTADGWWIVLRVDEGIRADGDYGGITWVPSVGWEFDRDNWDQWHEIVHEGAARESGFGLVVRLGPGESGLGPSVNLTPAWGATASGVHELWERGATAFSGYDAMGARMNARFS